MILHNVIRVTLKTGYSCRTVLQTGGEKSRRNPALGPNCFRFNELHALARHVLVDRQQFLNTRGDSDEADKE
jgi:hypothetical protein